MAENLVKVTQSLIIYSSNWNENSSTFFECWGIVSNMVTTVQITVEICLEYGRTR